jgi:phosphatidylglycerophosphatase A
LLGALNTRVFNYVASRGWSVPPFEAFRTTFLLMMLFVIIIVGIWAATRVEPLLGRKDPGAVVIDEVAGQLITFLFVPFNSGMWATVAGFVAFRLFDIWKPYPIRRLEALESGLGVMADDVLAGAYAAMLMSLLTSIYLLL